MSLSQSLAFLSSIGIAAWAGFVVFILVLGASLEDARRDWAEKSNHGSWRVTTAAKIVLLCVGACISFWGAGSANMARVATQRKLDIAQQGVTRALISIDAATGKIAVLNKKTKDLTKQTQSALSAANAAKEHAQLVALEIAHLNTDTERSLNASDALAKHAAGIATKSQHAAESASRSASSSLHLAAESAASAQASKHLAFAAAIKARVYRLPDRTITAIQNALRGLPNSTTAFIPCSSGLEEVCAQLTVAIRAVGLRVQISPAASRWTAGFDENPLAVTTNPNVVIAYMPAFSDAAHAIDTALSQAGLRVQIESMTPQTTAPNIEINVLYLGELP